MRAGLRVTHINGPGPQEPSSRSGAILPREGDTDTPHPPLSKHPARHPSPRVSQRKYSVHLSLGAEREV